ncbi:MAG: bifunctional ADP-dependent NAD(P)H-hydrate dehydratase/NAD(P)H-hydrate epimerase, partial [Kiritimatiellaceae bacterium]|nr:bifunctional ADP-dependent NAD(P)H-hydrate dehydratase/NAD(P)H-hydrate epimerase [Kiritimatiellaceae bacterium]
VSFLGQGIHPLDAAKTAVYLHGLAGDIAAERLSQEAMLPTDLIESLPQAFGVLSSY